MKFKNKIITLCLSVLLFFTSAIPSSASTIVAGGFISYELLMGLMAVGTVFGLSLPKDDNEYWDYTKSLKEHLHLVDDVYLERLEKSYSEWKFKNNNKPDDEKEPLKVPYIDGLSNLFDSVGKDVSKEYSVVGTGLEKLPYYSGSPSKDVFVDSIPLYSMPYNVSRTFNIPSYGMVEFVLTSAFSGYNCVKFRKVGTEEYTTLFNISSNLSVVGSPYIHRFSSSMDALGFAYKTSEGNFTKYTTSVSFEPSTYLPNVGINYTPSKPSVENDEITIPSFNEIAIPSTPSDLSPPFEVSDPLDVPSDLPGGDAGGDAVGDISPGLMQSIINLIVPSSDYWQNTFDNFFNNVGNAFPMIDISRFKDLCINGVPPKDIEVTIMGVKGKIFDTKYLNSIVDWLQPIVSAFMAFLLMLYNYRKVYKLIRGFEPFSGIADGNSVGEVRGKMDGAIPEMGGSSFVGPSTAGTWSDGGSVTRGSIQSKYYGRDL